MTWNQKAEVVKKRKYIRKKPENIDRVAINRRTCAIRWYAQSPFTVLCYGGF